MDQVQENPSFKGSGLIKFVQEASGKALANEWSPVWDTTCSCKGRTNQPCAAGAHVLGDKLPLQVCLLDFHLWWGPALMEFLW